VKTAIQFIIAFLTAASFAQASQGLTIYTTEVGVAKFHRADNKIHPYAKDNAWYPFILPDGAPSNQNLTKKNDDGSYTVFFLTLEDMMISVAKISQDEQKSVSLLSVHGHGLPGGMWFPRDTRDMNSLMCFQWRDAANGSDTGNYNQYYSAVSADEVEQIRDMSTHAANQMGCTTRLEEWQTVAARHPEFAKSLANDAQVSFLSCVVGLGKAGEVFTQGIAALLFPAGSAAKVQTSTNFGLGDWSMAEGMGFWDYISDSQLEHDNQAYPRDRQDSEMAQKGTLRVVQSSGSSWESHLFANQDFMVFNRQAQVHGNAVVETFAPEVRSTGIQYVRIPGTTVTIPVHH
jgi:hypothetical protein